jgi:hypothetical protein
MCVLVAISKSQLFGGGGDGICLKSLKVAMALT